MQIENTLNWTQKHAAESAVRINFTRVVKDDNGNVVSTSGEDQTITTPEVVAAAAQLESALVTALGVVLPTAG